MGNASGHHMQSENEWQWKKKMNKNTYNIKRVTKKFLEVSRCSCAKQRQRNVQKKMSCTFKVAFFAN